MWCTPAFAPSPMRGHVATWTDGACVARVPLSSLSRERVKLENPQPSLDSGFSENGYGSPFISDPVSTQHEKMTGTQDTTRDVVPIYTKSFARCSCSVLDNTCLSVCWYFVLSAGLQSVRTLSLGEQFFSGFRFQGFRCLLNREIADRYRS